MIDDRREVLAAVLDGHEWTRPRGYAGYVCSCGAEFDEGDGGEAARSHVAYALDAALAARESEPQAMTLSHDRLVLQRMGEGVDEPVVLVRCPHLIGLCFDGDDGLSMLPCPCNEPSVVLAELMPPAEHEGCDCTELCAMGPTCPGGMLAGLSRSGCWRTQEGERDGAEVAADGYVVDQRDHCSACEIARILLHHRDQVAPTWDQRRVTLNFARIVAERACSDYAPTKGDDD